MQQTKTPTYTTSRTRHAYPTAYIVGLVLAIVIFIPSLIIAHAHQLTGVQASIFRAVNNLPGGFTTGGLIITEGLGAAYPIIACVVIAAAFKRFRLAWRFFIAAGVTGIVMEIAKLLAKEPRPVVLLHGHLHARAQEGGLTSYPSGHVAIATALALTLWLILPRRWRWLSVVWILIVAFSRLYLGVHQPNDLIGGFVIGLGVICALRLLPAAIAKPLRLDGEDRLLKRH